VEHPMTACTADRHELPLTEELLRRLREAGM
jgi:hypothetical protein